VSLLSSQVATPYRPNLVFMPQLVIMKSWNFPCINQT